MIRDVTMAGVPARLLTLTAAITLACLTTLASHAQSGPASPPAASSAERPWVIVTLNGANSMTPSNLALDSAMQTALNEPGRHPVETFNESLDALRFPQAQIENETLALLAKKYATRRIDGVVAIGTAALEFAERHRNRLWP